MRHLFVALGLVIALCVAATADAGRGDPREALTKADQARAKAMLLRASDLAPGFVARRSSADADVYCAAVDESDLTITGKASSPQHTLVDATRFFVLGSTAQVYRTTKQASTSWRRGTSAKGVACAKKIFGALPGATLRSFRAQSFPKVAPKTVAYRLVMDLQAAGTTIRTYSDVIVLGAGRAQAALWILSGGRPLVRAEAVAFARKIAGRMATAMRGA
ncbi:MAG: hypothetical protein OEV72_05275 [Thermoleophilia bacterium]|nr:hypothetical protein [Thermoleophilia bacterium]MDH5332484.1 hypothetical protein [Thermoleophilia bacterium]